MPITKEARYKRRFYDYMDDNTADVAFALVVSEIVDRNGGDAEAIGKLIAYVHDFYIVEVRR
jgi:hypothetical protein